MPEIKVTETVIKAVEQHLPSGIKTLPTHLVRIALKHLADSNLSETKFLVLKGITDSDESFINSLENKNGN